MKIKQLTPKYARDAAKLHISGISSGFISSLGLDFVTALYEAISKSKYSFGFVAEENEEIIGFAAFTTNLKSLYKTVVFKNGLKFGWVILCKMISLSTIKKVFETLFYPARIKKFQLPDAELLSIVISEQARGKGLGTKLIEQGFDEAEKRQIYKVKTLAGTEMRSANNLYRKLGFKLVGQIKNHGILSNIYVAETKHFHQNP